MKTMKNILPAIATTAFLLGCNDNPRLEQALEQAGDNRRELEKVICHYSQKAEDSLKLQAACFLIENMPGHHTVEHPTLDMLRRKTDRDTASYFSRKMLDILLSELFASKYTCNKKEDIKHITSEFLIGHIEASFKLYSRPYYAKIPKEHFFRYVLPYRIGKERPELWRDSLPVSMPQRYTISSDIRNDIHEAASHLKFGYQGMPQFRDSILQAIYSKIRNQCQFLNLKHLFRDRIIGRPSALDYFPHYPNRNGLHYWVAYIDARKRTPFIEGAPKSKPAKVFRETFEHNNPLPANGNEYIPKLFRNPFIADVTPEYLYTKDIRITGSFPDLPDNRYCYLCVFNNLAWQPTAIGRKKGKNMMFKNMGTDIMYLPVCYDEKGKMIPAGHPFVLKNDGETASFTPDRQKRITLFLERKYPYDELQHEISACFSNGVIIASNDKEFRHADTVAFFPKRNHYYFSAEIPDRTKPYRYWRIIPASMAYFAEAAFYDRDSKQIPVPEGNHPIVFDGDVLTFTLLDKLTVDFGVPTGIARIVCLPRSDGNGIYPGNEYELFYYDKSWISLGRQTAKDYSLRYANVPAGALYWLRNLTTGVEERIFTWEDEAPQWW